MFIFLFRDKVRNGTEMIQDVEIREATLADKEAVLNIRDDIFEGRDYLLTFYDIFMTSRYTTSFVLVLKSKVVRIFCSVLKMK